MRKAHFLGHRRNHFLMVMKSERMHLERNITKHGRKGRRTKERKITKAIATLLIPAAWSFFRSSLSFEISGFFSI